MTVPSSILVKVDRQGRLVIPQNLRDDLTTTPGEVVLRPTEEGLLITAVPAQGGVAVADDGLPVLRLGRVVTNEEVLAAIDADRASR